MTDRDTGYDAAEVARVDEAFRTKCPAYEAAMKRLGAEVESLRDVVSRLNYENVQLVRRNGELRLHGSQLPDGVEWPRFEDGEPVRIGDIIDHDGVEERVQAVRVYRDAAVLSLAGCDHEKLINVRSGERVMHPPIYGKDGHPLMVGQTVYGHDGRAWKVTVLDHARLGHSPEYNVRAVAADGSGDRRELKAGWLTHEQPDSWERLEADAGDEAQRELVRRARALAEGGDAS